MVHNKIWETLDVSNIIALHDTDYLTAVEYTEICVAWIEFHRPDQSSVAMLWNTVPFGALCDRLHSLLGALHYAAHVQFLCNF